MRIFAAILGGWSESPLLVIDHRRDGRVVECGGLEIRCTARYRGFESLSLRNKKSKGCKSILTCILFHFPLGFYSTPSAKGSVCLKSYSVCLQRLSIGRNYLANILILSRAIQQWKYLI